MLVGGWLQYSPFMVVIKRRELRDVLVGKKPC